MLPFNYSIARDSLPLASDRLFMERRVCGYLFVERKLNSAGSPVSVFVSRYRSHHRPRAVNSHVIVELRAARNAIPRNGRIDLSRAAPRGAALVVADPSRVLSLSLSLSFFVALQSRRFNQRACEGKWRNYTRAASLSRCISIKRNSIDMDAVAARWSTAVSVASVSVISLGLTNNKGPLYKERIGAHDGPINK